MVALNDKEFVDKLYESIQQAPTPKHYIFKGKKCSEYESWHWTGWVKYSLEPFMSKEYLDAQEEVDKFFEDNKEVFSRCQEYWDNVRQASLSSSRPTHYLME